MKKVLSIFGTRPEAIKMAPVIKELEKHPDKFINRVCVTAQHRQMLDQVLDLFEIRPDYDLNIMKPGQDLFDVTCNVMQGLKKVLQKEQPDVVLVHGDTTTTMAASIAAFYSQIPVAHVEAGLRTHNKFAPFPEEINRQVTTRVTDLHFAPTETARRNLLAESIPESSIYITGNTVIDALLMVVDKVRQPEIRTRIEADLTARFPGLKDVVIGISGTTGNTHTNSGSKAPTWEPNPVKLQLPGQFAGTSKELEASTKQVPKSEFGHQEEHELVNRQRLVVVTGHRRENFGDGFETICQALKCIAAEHPDVEVVYPVHLNPNVQEPVNRILAEVPSVHLIEPLDYLPFVYLLDRAHLIITDSGGVQEEAPSLGKPVLVMRETTERPEAVDAGTVKLVGTSLEKIVGEARSLLTDPKEYKKMSQAHNPYGDGKACPRIVEAIHQLQKR